MTHIQVNRTHCQHIQENKILSNCKNRRLCITTNTQVRLASSDEYTVALRNCGLIIPCQKYRLSVIPEIKAKLIGFKKRKLNKTNCKKI